MSLLLIDDQGELWRGDSRQLRIAFDSPYSGGEFVEYAVKNLGFVAINVFGASCQARLRPGFVTERATKSLLDWLTRSRLERMVVSTFERDWKSQLIRVADAPEKVRQFLGRPETNQKPDFMANRLHPTALDDLPLVKDIVSAWPNLLSNYDTETLLRLTKSALGYRFAVIHGNGRNGERLTFKEISASIYSTYETWRSCAVGAPIEEQPDRAYGKWVANAYYDASQTGEPRCEVVDAIIRYPDRGRTRQRYRRLIFPIKGNDEGTLLIGGSLLDNLIDLRIPGPSVHERSQNIQ